MIVRVETNFYYKYRTSVGDAGLAYLSNAITVLSSEGKLGN